MCENPPDRRKPKENQLSKANDIFQDNLPSGLWLKRKEMKLISEKR